jgi:hypothetical protein
VILNSRSVWNAPNKEDVCDLSLLVNRGAAGAVEIVGYEGLFLFGVMTKEGIHVVDTITIQNSPLPRVGMPATNQGRMASDANAPMYYSLYDIECLGGSAWGIRTVRLDDETEKVLAQVTKRTG